MRLVAETITTVPALQSRAQPTLDQIIQPELVGGWRGAGTEMTDNPMHRCNEAPM
jgi:hypothetical protein